MATIPEVFDQPDAAFVLLPAGKKFPPIEKGWQHNGHAFAEACRHKGNAGVLAAGGYGGLDEDNPDAFQGLELGATTSWETRPGRLGFWLRWADDPAEILPAFGFKADQSQLFLFKEGVPVGEIKLQRAYQAIPSSWKTLEDGARVEYRLLNGSPPAEISLRGLLGELQGLGITFSEKEKPRLEENAAQLESMAREGRQKRAESEEARVRNYAAAALQGEVLTLAGTAEGSRNDQLNKSAFALGQFVAAGLLSDMEVIRALSKAATYAGLTPEEIEATIRSGLEAGAKHPREIPDSRARVGAPGQGEGGKGKEEVLEISEEELDAYSLPEGPKFECRLPNNHFLQKHMAYGSEISDAYPDYWLASGLFSLAVVADKKLKIILKQGTIYPNLYISINGKSSLSRKSTVVNKTEEMLCQVLWQLLSALIPTEFSPEAFTEHLSDHNHAPWIRDEAAGVLSLMKRDYMRGFKDSLMQLFDCKPFYRKLRTSQRKNVKTEFRVDDPYLNVLFATTEASLAANTDQNDTLSGFLARFLFFFPQGQKPKWLPLEEGTAQNSIFEGVIRDQLGGIAQKMDALKESTAMHFSPEAASYFTEWQRIREDEWTASNDGFCMQIYSRLAPTVAKLGMLFELGSPDFEVSKPIRLEFIQEACRLVDSYFMPTARAVYDLVGSNAEKNVIDRITAYLKNHGGKATKKEILRDVKIKSVDFKEYFATMLESGMVETKIVKRGGKGRDSLWVVLLDQGKVGNVTNVANVAKVAKVERDYYSIERKDSTLATLATKAILPSVAPKGKESQGIGPHPRRDMPTPEPEEIRFLARFRTEYTTQWARGGGRYESIAYCEGDECIAPLERALRWRKRGVVDLLEIVIPWEPLEEAPA